MKNVNQTTRMLCEGAVSIALAYALTFVELDLWFQGGSISAAMIPIIIFSVRWGLGWGVAAGAAFGTLKYFLGLDSFVISWVSIVFDYTGAYAMVGSLFRTRVRFPPSPPSCGYKKDIRTKKPGIPGFFAAQKAGFQKSRNVDIKWAFWLSGRN